MKRLICVGCGVGEDLDDPTGDIHPMQLVDLKPMYSETGPPDPPVQEDLCGKCRIDVKVKFFGHPEPDILNMPLMKAV